MIKRILSLLTILTTCSVHGYTMTVTNQTPYTVECITQGKRCAPIRAIIQPSKNNAFVSSCKTDKVVITTTIINPPSSIKYGRHRTKLTLRIEENAPNRAIPIAVQLGPQQDELAMVQL